MMLDWVFKTAWCVREDESNTKHLPPGAAPWFHARLSCQ